MKECRWKYLCPVYHRAERKEIDYSWVDNYCSVNNNSCVRYQMEERGEPHSDLMLPDGVIDLEPFQVGVGLEKR